MHCFQTCDAAKPQAFGWVCLGRMTGRLVAALVLAVVWSGIAAPAVAADRPNVLFLIADDLNTSLGCYGDPLVKSPNIDRLAARGVRFDRAYCQYPLCGPSRNSFLTGLYPNSTGILGNAQIFRQTIPAQPSMPQAFRRHGYFAGRIGKLYHYNVPNSIGTNGHDDPSSWELELNPAGCDRLEEQPQRKIFTFTPGQYGGTLSWYASPQPDERHTDALEAADAEWVLERCAKQKDRPFFLAVGFFRPHTPYVSPQKYFEMYPPDKMPVVTGIAEDQADIPGPALASRQKYSDEMTDDQRRAARQAYYASISFMDAQVGRVLDALDRLKLADNTIIVMTSDHGYNLGEHGLWQKYNLFEESCRVPLIIAAPGVSQKAVAAKSPVGMIDIFPTLAELCGVSTPKNIQGQSLVPMLKDPSVEGRGWSISQALRGAGVGRNGRDPTRFFGYTLRTPRWRYTEWDEGEKGRELYDHDADPRELTNLANEPAHAPTVAQLSEQLRAAVKATFPPSGKGPENPGMTWAPSLIDE